MKYFNDWEAMLQLIGQLQEGIGATLLIFAATLVFSIPLGMIVALGQGHMHI